MREEFVSSKIRAEEEEEDGARGGRKLKSRRSTTETVNEVDAASHNLL